MKSKGFLTYYDILPALEQFSDEERGQLWMACLKYGKDGTMPVLGEMVMAIFLYLRPQIDRDAAKYENKLRNKNTSGVH